MLTRRSPKVGQTQAHQNRRPVRRIPKASEILRRDSPFTTAGKTDP